MARVSGISNMNVSRRVYLTLCNVILSSFFVWGCIDVPVSRISQIHIGMPKSQVDEILGWPRLKIGEVTNRFGQEIEIFEYRLMRKKTRKQSTDKKRATKLTLGLAYPVQFRGGNIADYWLFYVDERVVRGEGAGNFEAIARKIYNIRAPLRIGDLLKDIV